MSGWSPSFLFAHARSANEQGIIIPTFLPSSRRKLSTPPLFLSFSQSSLEIRVENALTPRESIFENEFSRRIFVLTKFHLRSIIYTKKRPRIVPLHPHPSPPGAPKSPPPFLRSPNFTGEKGKTICFFPPLKITPLLLDLSPTPVFPDFHRRS